MCRQRFVIALLAFKLAAAPQTLLALDIQVDFDSEYDIGGPNPQPIATYAGFTSWLDLNSNARRPFPLNNPSFDPWNMPPLSIPNSDVVFEVFSNDANSCCSVASSRNRRPSQTQSDAYNDLTRDFIFADGNNNYVGLRISGLDPGIYQMRTWHFDLYLDDPLYPLVYATVRLSDQGGAAQTVGSAPFGAEPIAFEFAVTAPGQVKEVLAFGSTSQSRFNGFALASISTGDYNRDGAVDMDDYSTWKASYGSSVAAFFGADGNGDGIVNAADYTVWRDNLSAGGTHGLATVPEPGTVILAMFGSVFSCSRRRRFVST